MIQFQFYVTFYTAVSNYQPYLY